MHHLRRHLALQIHGQVPAEAETQRQQLCLITDELSYSKVWTPLMKLRIFGEDTANLQSARAQSFSRVARC